MAEILGITTVGIQSHLSSDVADDTLLKDLQENQEKMYQRWQVETMRRDAAEMKLQDQLTKLHTGMSANFERLSNILDALQLQLIGGSKGEVITVEDSILGDPPPKFGFGSEVKEIDEEDDEGNFDDVGLVAEYAGDEVLGIQDNESLESKENVKKYWDEEFKEALSSNQAMEKLVEKSADASNEYCESQMMKKKSPAYLRLSKMAMQPQNLSLPKTLNPNFNPFHLFPSKFFKTLPRIPPLSKSIKIRFQYPKFSGKSGVAIDGGTEFLHEAKGNARQRSKKMAESLFYRLKNPHKNYPDNFSEEELQMISLGYDRLVRFMEKDDPNLKHPYDWYKYGKFGPYSWRGVVLGDPILGDFFDERVTMISEVRDQEEWEKIEQHDMASEFQRRLDAMDKSKQVRYFWVFVRHPKWRVSDLPWQQWTLVCEVAVEVGDQRLDKWALIGRLGNKAQSMITQCAAWMRPDIIYLKRPIYQSRFEPQDEFFDALVPLLDPETEQDYMCEMVRDGDRGRNKVVESEFIDWVEELNKMPKNLTSIADAVTSFMNKLGSIWESLRRILLQREFDKYLDATEMYATARLAEMLNKFSLGLQPTKSEDKNIDSNENFLVNEIKILEESQSVKLLNFIPKSAFRTLLAKVVKEIYVTPFDCAGKIWSYIETVVISVLLQHYDSYLQLISCTRRAAQNLITKKKQQSVNWVGDIVEMEKLTDYTCNTEYTATWNKLMSDQDEFMKVVHAAFPLAAT
ncbi:hypothetical protein C2S53_000658 [Perilla frutescens var. hirtella]|uniref:Dynamin stalk domain-containing protein n=1 Tax=Perilla frutescens var. hirtella TaxID=608512 RepID=A0AAD4J1A6_PERFH|nr:hypothetical protein C2S53_000658 [Perilla frutescens var. hirtella]